MPLSHTRSIAELQAEAERPTLRRALGPLHLTALGIGSVIGTGIFVLTGTAAALNAGPGLVISMIIAAVTCALAGLCYAELASMIPLAGSAYTYASASAGELVAWVIGWDLILEYALSASTIAGTHGVTREGRPVSLRPKEYELLRALLRRAGRVATRNELLREVWGYRDCVVSRTLDTHVGELRRKLEDDPARPRHILTVRKAGYGVADHEVHLPQGHGQTGRRRVRHRRGRLRGRPRGAS